MTIRERYNKERRRILSQGNRMVKKGYVFFDFEIPSIPKKITEASIRRLQKITSKKLYEKADYLNRQTGEVEEATAHKNRARVKAAKKAAVKRQEQKAEIDFEYAAKLAYKREQSYNDTVIRNYLRMCLHFPSKAYPVIKSWIDRLINEKGKTAVAEMITTGLENGMMLTSAVAYSGMLDNYLAEMLNYLPGVTEEDNEALTEIMEEDEDGFEIED